MISIFEEDAVDDAVTSKILHSSLFAQDFLSKSILGARISNASSL